MVLQDVDKKTLMAKIMEERANMLDGEMQG
jgi:hypothetical protein